MIDIVQDLDALRARVAGWKREELLDGTRRAAVDGSGTTAAL